jgi:2'-5' RNA ligase
MPKYNLALTPISQAEKVIKFAANFSNLSDKYLLGKDSLPHVTLYQFEEDENEIEKIWERVETLWKEEPIQLKFNEFSFTTSNGIIFWIALLPNKRDKLHAMHHTIADILFKPTKKIFDPHMTLCNSKMSDGQTEITRLKKFYKPISDRFILSLGLSDEAGQLIHIIRKAKT